MAARGRSAGFQMGAEHRTKIANSKILKRLIDHASGDLEEEMSQSQVTAALALLKKVMPDLQPIDPDTGKGGVTFVLPDSVRDIL